MAVASYQNSTKRGYLGRTIFEVRVWGMPANSQSATDK